MSINYNKCPFPWWGGKQHAAPLIWGALGDVGHYVEPFAGSIATLLLRPHQPNRTYHSETVNDLDGFLVNFWRSVQLHPDATAEAASWPVSEADLHARHLWLLRWKAERELEHLMGDPEWCDPKAAGYWAWGQSSWIGSGWCSGRGPWVVGANGRIEKRPRAAEPAVWRQLPQIHSNGQGVNHAGTREPGVEAEEEEYHPMTMPELRRWFAYLSARLRHVRILAGDWRRATTNGATISLSCDEAAPCGVFLDPPYAGGVRTADLYTEDSSSVAADVRVWCVENGSKPLLRIVLAGFSGEGHEELVDLGWREIEWYTGGFLRGGMANTGDMRQQHLERLWLSPGCLGATPAPQLGLFE